jgi:hypothetical protein
MSNFEKIVPLLLGQAGLIFELAGAFVLAAPSLSRSGLRRIVIGNRINYNCGCLIGLLTTSIALFLATVLLYYDRSTILVWIISLMVCVSWMPALVKLILPGIPEAGREPTDQESDRLHLTGIALLATGFAIQGLVPMLH